MDLIGLKRPKQNESSLQDSHQKPSTSTEQMHETARTTKDFHDSLLKHMSEMQNRLIEEMRRHEDKINALYVKLGLKRHELRMRPSFKRRLRAGE